MAVLSMCLGVSRKDGVPLQPEVHVETLSICQADSAYSSRLVQNREIERKK